MNKMFSINRLSAVSCIAVIAFAVVAAGSDTTLAQSGSRTKSGSGSAAKMNRVALEGYCPVCIIDMKKWVRGVSQFQAKYDGKTYLFPGAEQQKTFLDNPAKYVPALGGDCIVYLVNAKKLTPGNIRYAAFHRNRLFLFPNTQAKEVFLGNREQFENVDLVLNGLCSVCRVEMGKDVPGKPEFTVIHGGMRYLFPAEEQRQMFIANPAKYAVGLTN